jgi:glutamyl-tRNA(Gln) amidotransferase subunit E
MPGSARMYPETDLPLLKISRELINHAKKNLPKLKQEIEEELKGTGMNKEMIKLILKNSMIEEFKELLGIINNPDLIVKMLVVYPREISKRENIPSERIERFLNKDSLIFVFKKEDSDKIEEKIIKLIKEKPGLSEKAYMGLIMGEFKGKISGKDAIDLIKKYL